MILRDSKFQKSEILIHLRKFEELLKKMSQKYALRLQSQIFMLESSRSNLRMSNSRTYVFNLENSNLQRPGGNLSNLTFSAYRLDKFQSDKSQSMVKWSKFDFSNIKRQYVMQPSQLVYTSNRPSCHHHQHFSLTKDILNSLKHHLTLMIRNLTKLTTYYTAERANHIHMNSHRILFKEHALNNP